MKIKMPYFCPGSNFGDVFTGSLMFWLREVLRKLTPDDNCSSITLKECHTEFVRENMSPILINGSVLAEFLSHSSNLSHGVRLATLPIELPSYKCGDRDHTIEWWLHVVTWRRFYTVCLSRRSSWWWALIFPNCPLGSVALFVAHIKMWAVALRKLPSQTNVVHQYPVCSCWKYFSILRSSAFCAQHKCVALPQR